MASKNHRKTTTTSPAVMGRAQC